MGWQSRIGQGILLGMHVACVSNETKESLPPAELAATWLDAPRGAVPLKQGLSTTLQVRFDRGFAPVGVQVLEQEGIAATLEDGNVRLFADYSVSGLHSATLMFRDARDQQVTRPIQVDVRELSWAGRVAWRNEGPEAREHASLFVDAERRSAYLFQGSGYEPQGTPLRDAWRFDLETKTWSPWEPTGDVPEPGLSRRVAQSGAGTYFMYGGSSTTKLDTNFYRVDVRRADRNVSKLAQVRPPPGRTLHAMAYDAQIGVGVVFGGVDTETNTVLADTWLFRVANDVVTWNALETETRPSGRYGAFFALDEVSKTFYLWSGGQVPTTKSGVNPAQDLWALRYALQQPRWELVVPSGELPKGRRNGCMMHDVASRRLMIFGGTATGRSSVPGLSILDLHSGIPTWTTRTEPSPPLRSSGIGFFDQEGELGYCGFGNEFGSYRDLNLVGHRK
jgi:hypothetical protein